MPLPQNNTAWPPAPWGTAYSAYAENDAWYTGDTAALERVYQTSGSGVRPSHRVRGQEFEGGLMGFASRAFWGRPIPAGQSRTKLHIPAPADIAMLSSDLLFAEPPTAKLEEGEKNKKAQERLDLIANDPLAHRMLSQAGELSSAFGAVCLTTQWDKQTREHAFIRESAADVIVPEFRFGSMVAVTLWTESVEGSVYWRHLERHEIGYQLHGLYAGTATNLGIAHPLADHSMTAPYAALVDANGGIPTGIDRLTASLMINLPARLWRKRGDLAHAGRSDYSPAMKGLFGELDKTWSSWMRDLDLGRARVLVPAGYLQSNGLGRGASFDTDQEIFSPLNIPGQATSGTIEQVQFEIRVDEHERTSNAIFQKILETGGFKDLDDEDRATPTTATGVLDETRAKERMRDKKALSAALAWAEQTSVALELDGIVFSGKGGGRFDRPKIEFPETSQEDPEKNARVIQMHRAASVVSIETGVRMRDSTLDDIAVGKEVARIMQETGRTVPDPALLDRSNPTQDALAKAAARITGQEGDE